MKRNSFCLFRLVPFLLIFLSSLVNQNETHAQFYEIPDDHPLITGGRCDAAPGTGIEGQVAQQGEISASVLLSGAWDCTKNFFQGVWDSTGGLVANIGECLWSPWDCAGKAVQAAKNAYAFATNLVDEAKKVFSALTQLPVQDMIDILCAIVGSIGTDVAIAILTAGAGAALVAKTAAKLSLKIPKLAKIIGHLKEFGVPLKKVADMADDALDAMHDLMSKGYGIFAREALKACAL